MRSLTKKFKASKIGNLLSKHRVFIYPIVIFVIFLILVLFRISGTSIGIYHDYLYGNTSKDTNLLYGKPRPIRSDEWLVATQYTIIQEQNGFNRINTNLLGGQDVSILTDAPYKDWSAVLKPQNFSFFILPFEYAFAFKWWILLVALLISSYSFALKILNKKITLAILFSVIISFSPFVFWWYQSITILPIVYGFLLLLVGMSIVEKTNITFKSNTLKPTVSAALKTTLFTYLLCCFALVFYPPFQIPIALSVVFFLIGHLLNQKLSKKDSIKIGLPVLVSVVMALTVIGAFALTRVDAIKTITGTAYPGKRVLNSGKYNQDKLIVTYLQPLLQSNARGGNYISNQSESSNFILTPFYLVVPFLSLFVWLYIRKKRFDWVLFCLLLCNLLFLAYLFVPNIDIVAKIFLLNIVPHDRLLIGLGFLTIITLIYAAKLYEESKLKITKKVAIIMSLYLIIIFGIMMAAGLQIRHLYPLFVSNRLLILGLGLIVLIGVALIIFKRLKFGLAIIALFSIISVVYIHPLYVGLGPVYNSNITKTVQKLSPPNATWAAAGDIFIEHVPQMSGRPAITGLSAYPNNKFWEQYSEGSDALIYNRYAHIILLPNDDPLKLLGNDTFSVSESCERKVSQKIDYVISINKLDGNCEHLLKTVTYPNATFYFYKQ
jgi:hypothetical protein